MYSISSPGLQRSSDEDERLRRDSKINVNAQQPPSLTARSPTHVFSYSPTNGTHPQSPYNQYSSRPSSSTALPMPTPTGVSPRLGPPPSPKSNGPAHNSIYVPRDGSNSTFYDPTSEHREGQTGRNQPLYSSRSPVQVSGEQFTKPVNPFSRIGLRAMLMAVTRAEMQFRTPATSPTQGHLRAPITRQRALKFPSHRQLSPFRMAIHQVGTARFHNPPHLTRPILLFIGTAAPALFFSDMNLKSIQRHETRITKTLAGIFMPEAGMSQGLRELQTLCRSRAFCPTLQRTRPSR